MFWHGHSAHCAASNVSKLHDPGRKMLPRFQLCKGKDHRSKCSFCRLEDCPQPAWEPPLWSSHGSLSPHAQAMLAFLTEDGLSVTAENTKNSECTQRGAPGHIPSGKTSAIPHHNGIPISWHNGIHASHGLCFALDSGADDGPKACFCLGWMASLTPLWDYEV